MVLRWGIAGSGKICNDFTLALKVFPTAEHVVQAVAAASGKEKAEVFAKKHGIKVAYGSYEELAKNKEVDVIYVGSLNPQHFPNSKLFLEHGKAVLCEKPMCMNYKEVDILVKLAKEKNLFLMEGFWTRCFPVYDELRKQLAAGTLGEVLHVQTFFGVKVSGVDRLSEKELGGGTILDFGVYGLQLVVLLFGNEKPITVKAAGHVTKGVDESVSCVITYPGGRTAVVTTNSRVDLPNTSYIIGTKGTIEISQYCWAPWKMVILGKEKVFPLPTVESKFEFTDSVGLHYEAAEVKRCLMQGFKESPLVPHSDSLAVAYLADAIRNELGVSLEA